MSIHYLVMALPLLFSPSPAQSKAISSWAKPGVSFEQYRTDSVQCAELGYFRDISQDEPTKRFVRGFRSADDDLNKADIGGPNVDRWLDAVRRTQPDRRKREIQEIQVGEVERCLTERGYSKFLLTKDEQKQLSKFPLGSIDRHRFLHQLASR
jgi:hypothetical protein